MVGMWSIWVCQRAALSIKTHPQQVAHLRRTSSPWWESSQQLQLEKSQFIEAWCSQEWLYCFICEKSGKWWKIVKNFQSHINRKVNSKGGGERRWGASKGAAEKCLWHQREESVMSTKGNHGYEFQGIKTLSTQLIPVDVSWITLRWPNMCTVKPCQPPAGQFVLILHTLLALLLDPEIKDPWWASPNLTRVDTAWLISQQNSEATTGLRRQFYFGALDFKQIK